MDTDNGVDQGDCPATFALNLISRKWSVHILFSLVQRRGAPIRFGQLQKSVAGISQRELTKHLRAFEQHGIVRREVFPVVPPRVEYTLTAVGLSLMGPLQALHDWAAAYGPKIQKTDT